MKSFGNDLFSLGETKSAGNWIKCEVDQKTIGKKPGIIVGTEKKVLLHAKLFVKIHKYFVTTTKCLVLSIKRLVAATKKNCCP